MTFRTLTSKATSAIATSLVPLLSFLPPSAYAQSTFTPEINQRPPAPPSAPPVNDTRPGGGLDADDDFCRDLGDGLRALIPVESPVLTATTHPTFLVYIPAGAEAVQYGEFSLLLWPGEETRHYQTRFTLPESPGIVSITIPELPAHALAEDQIYRWYFQLYCGADEGAQPDLTLSGTVQRVALTPERSQQIEAVSPAIWYDSLANVANELKVSPSDEQLQTTWRSLMQIIDAKDAEAAPFVGPVLLVEE